MKISANKSQHGSLSLLVLILGLVMSVAVGGLIVVVSTQYISSTRTESYEQSLFIAQAGADNYLWRLSHNKEDYTGTNGQPQAINDPYGNIEGYYQITITPPGSGSSIITINSLGWLKDHPEIKRSVIVKVGYPSIAKYTFLQNANLWFGQKDEIHGKIFTNGGIRMDGTHDSTVQSAKATYTCGLESGCDPPIQKPGIWGDGGPQALWEYPVTAIDFDSIPINYNDAMNQSKTQGLYLEASGGYGYHITFASNGNYTVKKVTNATNIQGWSIEYGCEDLYQKIKNESIVGSYSVATKPLIFAEDNVWVDGVVKGKATIYAVRLPIDLNSMNIWINNNITYLAKDGTNNLGLIAQNHIIIGLEVPQDLEINGALLSQKGKLIRHNYKTKECGHQNEAVRQTLNLYGSISTNLRSYWNYGQGDSGFGSEPVSGFSHRYFTYDPNLYYSPPPFFPYQGKFEIISWEER